MNRVVITGLGPVTPIGLGKNDFLKGLTQSRDGIREIPEDYGLDLPIDRAGIVEGFEEHAGVIPQKKKDRFYDRFSLMAMAGANLALLDAQAVSDSDLTLDENIEPSDVSICLGVGIGGATSFEQGVHNLDTGKPLDVGVGLPLKVMPNAAPAYIALHNGITGGAVSVNSACSSSLDAIGIAYRQIKDGYRDMMVTGGIEACVTPLMVRAFLNMRAISKTGIIRPFDKDRDGFVPGEGGGILVLESEGHAIKRGAKIYAEVRGYDQSTDASDMTAPNPDGLGLAIERAFWDARINESYITSVNCHGTGTKLNDVNEFVVFKRVFGQERAESIPAYSVKSQIGHLVGGGAAAELIAGVLSLDHRFVPPTINFKMTDPECPLNICNQMRQGGDQMYVLKTSAGFGGHNAAMIICKYQA